MPSDTFFRLDGRKQERLLKEAKREFSRVPFEEASINQMIKATGISRGSFYHYFRNKEDLYLLEQYQSDMFLFLEENLKKENGDFFLVMEGLLREALVFGSKEENRTFLMRIIENTTIFKGEKMEKESFSNRIKEILSSANFCPLAKKYCMLVFIKTMHLLMANLFCYLHQLESDDEVMRKYKEQLDLLRYGVYRKDEETC